MEANLKKPRCLYAGFYFFNKFGQSPLLTKASESYNIALPSQPQTLKLEMNKKVTTTTKMKTKTKKLK